MNGVLVAFEIVLIVPLFVASFRTSLLGLSLQGALMAWLAFRHGAHLSAETAILFVDLVVVRAIGAPLLFYRVLRAQNAPRRNDVIAPNLFSWTVALVLVLMSFRVADRLVPVESDARTLVAVATSAILLGMLVLSTRSPAFSQTVGALRIENGIALFELGAGSHHEALPIRLGQTVVFLVTVVFFRWYLVHLHADASRSHEPTSERAAL